MRHRLSLGALVWSLSLRWRNLTDRALADLGLTHAQFAALDLLGQSSEPAFSGSGQAHRPSSVPPFIQSHLARALDISPIFASKLARALERDGLIARASVAGDARARGLVLTERGSTVLRQARSRVAALEARLVEPLGDSETQAGLAMRILLRTLIAHENGAREQGLRGASWR